MYGHTLRTPQKNGGDQAIDGAITVKKPLKTMFFLTELPVLAVNGRAARLIVF